MVMVETDYKYFTTRQPDTTHVVSKWHIPGGWDYTNAKPTTLFFSDKESAEGYAKQWENPPEMAMVFTIAEHEAALYRHAQRQPCARCGDYREGHIDRIDARPGQCDSWVESLAE